MSSKAFRRGVADARGVRSPRFDKETEGGWFYDWGRQFAMIAPRDMRIVVNGRLNPDAVKLFKKLDTSKSR